MSSIEKDIDMLVEFIGKKAEMASSKHFGGKLSATQMKELVIVIIKNAEYVGQSDRSNGRYAPAKIVWATVAGITMAVVLDSNDIAKNKATVISLYDVRNVEVKAKRFGMKKVVK